MSKEKNVETKTEDENEDVSSVLYPTDPKTKFFTTRDIVIFLMVSIFTALILGRINISLITSTIFPYVHKICEKVKPPSSTNHQPPTYWVPDDGQHLQVVHKLFQTYGFQKNTTPENWDVLWTHQYPFTVYKNLVKNLKWHQKVNHFPGCGYFTNKVDLSTTGVDFMPKSFRIPDDVDELKIYAKENPEYKFIVKGNMHRNIEIVDVDEIDLTKNTTFIQRFVDNPYLVDGHKFDMGVYTVITSVDPLRVYIYNGDVLFRYCSHPYHPFNASDLDQYVIAEDYLPTWEVPSLKVYYNEFGYSMRDSFDAYVKNKGGDPRKVWEQVERSLRDILVLKEEKMKTVTKRFKSTHNFFELYRFDFGLDENLNVFLMEANMSPNLSPAHFKPNRLLYEQVVYNVFKLVGIGNLLSTFFYILGENTQMLSANKNILVNAEVCSSYECNNSCSNKKCSLCLHCLTTKDVEDLHMAYQEHMNRGDCKRIFPEKMVRNINLKKYSHKNQLIIRWFNEKCKADYTWC
ncbi:LOW QUALITY PROTEIN: tubulin polyglutamylase TTLL6-like [Ctenocephalides felis]|uniref:LOW QUALITY PROTEIN: tubulin polyglutamylase TTLL6-like n=1 Tax=Ctenocephalides felis TaxID=7515 RepID=UPI000E6E3611|nr:LOW QUALITY PROTEIN: tubulin polyglutamylase TTLL6-like [Ctenocephalides felis]